MILLDYSVGWTFASCRRINIPAARSISRARTCSTKTCAPWPSKKGEHQVMYEKFRRSRKNARFRCIALCSKIVGRESGRNCHLRRLDSKERAIPISVSRPLSCACLGLIYLMDDYVCVSLLNLLTWWYDCLLFAPELLRSMAAYSDDRICFLLLASFPLRLPIFMLPFILRFILNEYSLRFNGWTGVPGEPVPVSDEKDVFDWLGMKYQAPPERNGWSGICALKTS